MGFVVYILKSRHDGKLYVGQTNDLQHRVTQHNNPNGKSYTAKRGPWVLAHHETHPNRAAAMARERFLKSVAGSRDKRKLAQA